MKKINWGFLFLAVWLLALPAQGYAQNEEILGNEDVALIGLGTVSRIEPDQLVVTEYEYETDNEQEVAYKVNEKTDFENIQGLADLKLGDSVEVVYTDEAGKRTAVSISKEEDYIEGEGTDNGTADPKEIAPTVNPVAPEITNIIIAK